MEPSRAIVLLTIFACVTSGFTRDAATRPTNISEPIADLADAKVSNCRLFATSTDQVRRYLSENLKSLSKRHPEFSIITVDEDLPCDVRIKEDSISFLDLLDRVCRQVGWKWSLNRRALVIQRPPPENKSQRPPIRPIVCEVDSSGHVTIEAKAVKIAELETLLQSKKKEHPDAAVVIRASPECKWKHVAEIMGTCRSAGVTRISAKVQSEEAP